MLKVLAGIIFIYSLLYFLDQVKLWCSSN